MAAQQSGDSAEQDSRVVAEQTQTSEQVDENHVTAQQSGAAEEQDSRVVAEQTQPRNQAPESNVEAQQSNALNAENNKSRKRSGFDAYLEQEKKLLANQPENEDNREDVVGVLEAPAGQKEIAQGTAIDEKTISRGEELRQKYGDSEENQLRRKAMLQEKLKRYKESSAQEDNRVIEVSDIAPQKANEFLREALRRQELTRVPENMKEPQRGQTWIIGDYKYEVRVHPGDPRYTNAGTIFRVARKSMRRDDHLQGSGSECLGVNNQWYRTRDIKLNETLAKLTHIKIRRNENED